MTRRASALLGIALAALLMARAGSSSSLQPVATHHITGDVWEFDYVLKSAGHTIGLHAVVRLRAGTPVPTRRAVFMVHGDGWNFDGAFMRGGTGAPVYLAEHGVDVWGVDLGWTRVEPGANPTWARGWGLQEDVDDIEHALSVAESTRGGGKMTLLGWSRGGWDAYALVEQESQWPAARRQISGLIPVDTIYRTNDAAARASMCAVAQSARGSIATGVYVSSTGTDAQLGRAALRAPTRSNEQAAFAIATQTGQFGSPTATFHYAAGTPTGLRYTAPSAWFAFLAAARPLEPTQIYADTGAIACGTPEARFTAHLDDVRMPVFYVGAAGGFGAAGLYTLRLLGSKEQSHRIVRLLPRAQAADDFGHVDLWTARNARSLVWAPILAWIRAHA